VDSHVPGYFPKCVFHRLEEARIRYRRVPLIDVVVGCVLAADSGHGDHNVPHFDVAREGAAPANAYESLDLPPVGQGGHPLRVHPAAPDGYGCYPRPSVETGIRLNHAGTAGRVLGPLEVPVERLEAPPSSTIR